MNENNLTKRILLRLSQLRTLRLFRNNVGMAWVGKVVNKSHNHITLTDYRPFHAGLHKGSSDLIGWKTVTVTPDMVGKQIAIFVSTEIKTPKGRVSKDQQNWLLQVQKAGGIANVMRSEVDAQNYVDFNSTSR